MSTNINVSTSPFFSKDALNGKRILITGATSGIGANAAELFSSLGSHIVLVGRHSHKIDAIAEALPRNQYYKMTVDLSVPDSIFHAIKSLPPEWLPLHGVFHAAGCELVKPIRLSNSNDFDSLMSVSSRAALNIARAVSSKGIMSDGGSLVFMSSVAAINGTPGLVLYSASKGAIEASTRCLAVELASKNIRVNAITAGAVESPMHKRLTKSMSEASVFDYQNRHPLGFGKPSDISNLAAFLISDASRWMTGACLLLDGGYSAL